MAAEEHPGEADCGGPGGEGGQGEDGVDGRVRDTEEEGERYGPRRVARREGELVGPHGDEHLALIVARAPATSEGLEIEVRRAYWEACSW